MVRSACLSLATKRATMRSPIRLAARAPVRRLERGECFFRSVDQAFAVRSDIKHSRECSATIGDGRAVEAVLNGAVEAHAVGIDDAIAHEDAPLVVKKAVLDGLTHGGPSEDDGFAGEQPGCWVEPRLETPPEPAAVEKDGLLRQPFGVSVRLDDQGCWSPEPARRLHSPDRFSPPLGS